MNKRKFFLLPICLLLLGACNSNSSSPESKADAKSSGPEVSSVEDVSSQEEVSSQIEVSSQEEVSSSEEISSEPHTHVYGEWQVTMIATCTEKGEETRYCECGASETREVNALGHKWDAGEMTTRPTGAAEGVTTFTCERCGATKTEPIAKVDGYTITFNQGEHFKVYVYNTQDYTSETPTETNSCKAKDKYGNVVEYDPADALDQPQVNFKIVCDEGYSVGINDVAVVGADGTTKKGDLYKNFKQGPNETEGLPDDEHYRITKIQRSLNITITPINGEQKMPEVTFVKNHCSVIVYKSATISDENIVTDEHFYARDKTSGEIVQTGGQIYFKVVPETGYVWNNGVTGDTDVKDLPFCAQNSENSGNKFKPLGDGVYNITKVNDDLSILVNCTPEGGEAGLGYEVTFVTEHCTVLIYQTQDYQFTPTAPTDNKTITRTSKGDAAQYVAASDGVAEVKPQVNFLIVLEEGYTVAKANIVITGDYNKLEQGNATLNPNIWKITKIKSNLTVTITAVAAA